jgi:mannonate dehydratase
MPMQMGWRWYGEDNDPITLSDIKQIPGVTSIVWALHHKMPGEIWEENEIKEVMDQIHAYGFNGDVVEPAYPRPVYRKLQAVHPQPVQVWR